MQMGVVSTSKPITVHCIAHGGTLQEAPEGTITSHSTESLNFCFLDLCWEGAC